MNDPTSRRGGTTAGGSLLAISIVGGGVIGLANGQPTIGLLAGFGIGVLIVLVIWLMGRR